MGWIGGRTEGKLRSARVLALVWQSNAVVVRCEFLMGGLVQQGCHKRFSACGEGEGIRPGGRTDDFSNCPLMSERG